MQVKRRNFLIGAAAASASGLSGNDAGLGTSIGTSIGTRLPPEAVTTRDALTGRTIRRLTSAKAHSYPIYYFTPSITSDNRYLVFHSERSGWVELYRMDLESGESVQLTEGRTRNSGWMIWCEWHLRGVYNHLSALNQARRELYYFQDEELHSTHVETLAHRVVHRMPGRIPIGQSSFSPDGRHYAFIHADRRNYVEVMSDVEALKNMKQARPFQEFRSRVPATIGLIDTQTGRYSDIVKLDFHVHHVIFADNRRVLVNHIRNGNGMWIVGIDGSGMKTLRPPDDHGAIVHQVVTQAGIYYEAVGDKARSGAHNWFGRYDLGKETFEEVALPEIDGYVHTGLDPAGRFLFFEESGRTHHISSLHFPHIAGRSQLKVLRTMPPYPAAGQRFHAHPFLSPDRKWLFYTEPVDGYSQVCAIDVRDLVDLDEYWDRRG